jgi:hypothetical protein
VNLTTIILSLGGRRDVGEPEALRAGTQHRISALVDCYENVAILKRRRKALLLLSCLRDRSTTKYKTEQAEELLSVFFSLLPAKIKDEGPRPYRTAVSMPPLTIEEVERGLFAAKSWKAPGRLWATSHDMEAGMAGGERQSAAHQSGRLEQLPV